MKTSSRTIDVNNLSPKSKKWSTQPVRFNNRALAKENDGNGQDEMRGIPLRYLKRGEYFKVTPTDSATIWKKSDYDRQTKRYFAEEHMGDRERLMKPSKIVYVGFYF